MVGLYSRLEILEAGLILGVGDSNPFRMRSIILPNRADVHIKVNCFRNTLHERRCVDVLRALWVSASGIAKGVLWRGANALRSKAYGRERTLSI